MDTSIYTPHLLFSFIFFQEHFCIVPLLYLLPQEKSRSLVLPEPPPLLGFPEHTDTMFYFSWVCTSGLNPVFFRLMDESIKETLTDHICCLLTSY
ncbi:unnamed protein product [Lactuca virosa]|uniref:Uncharacterized protein n=1 Tax=Lactuca virosa TaxID=75947 RepID=A0AAU9NNX5_9ASTR|nr:unnamed protein product [Lactuca virosa]